MTNHAEIIQVDQPTTNERTTKRPINNQLETNQRLEKQPTERQTKQSNDDQPCRNQPSDQPTTNQRLIINQKNNKCVIGQIKSQLTSIKIHDHRSIKSSPKIYV